MSAKAATASRREVRRAFGPQAVQTLVDHEDALGALAKASSHLSARLDGISASLATSRGLTHEELTNLWRMVSAHEKRLDWLTGIYARGFLGRLRWLLTGK